MNKSDLTQILAREAGLSLRDAKTAVDCLFETHPCRGIIASELDRGRKVTIAGFGTFEMRGRKGRVGRNPRTGQPIRIDASEYPAFRAGISLKKSNHGLQEPVRQRAADRLSTAVDSRPTTEDPHL